jgi:hypothetical protein
VSERPFDPLRIVKAFNHRGVEYVVIGGFAGELHDAGVPPTRDIDFTPKTTPENLGRLSQVFTDLKARIRTDVVPEGLPFSHDADSLSRAGVWNLICEFGEFDISFRPSGTEGYDDLVRNALRLTVGDQQMPVASLADVIRSKEAAGRDKDLRALPGLLDRLDALEGTPDEEQATAMARRAEERIPAPPPPASSKAERVHRPAPNDPRTDPRKRPRNGPTRSDPCSGR